MKVIVLFLAAQLAAAQTIAASYYKGQQPVGIAGDTVDCYIEADYLNVDQALKLRVLAADPHDGDLIGLGPVVANYEASKTGYYFLSSDDHDKVQELLLAVQSPLAISDLSMVILDGNHADVIKCTNPEILQGNALELILEKFEHFDDYTDDHDHDHDHSH
jgi:hypothetical protein